VNVVFLFGAGADYKDSSRTIASIGPGGLSLPDREYYLKTDAKSVETRQKFDAHLNRMFRLIGVSVDDAASAARSVMSFEMILAKAAPDRASLRNPENRYHPMTRAQWQDVVPGARWGDFLKELNAPEFDSINVVSPDYLRNVGAELEKAPVDMWKAY